MLSVDYFMCSKLFFLISYSYHLSYCLHHSSTTAYLTKRTQQSRKMFVVLYLSSETFITLVARRLVGLKESAVQDPDNF